MPTLVMQGEKDRIVPERCARLFTAAIPNAQLIIYEGAGHLPHREVPNRSATDLKAFIASLPAQRADAQPEAARISFGRGRASCRVRPAAGGGRQRRAARSCCCCGTAHRAGGPDGFARRHGQRSAGWRGDWAEDQGDGDGGRGGEGPAGVKMYCTAAAS